MAEKIVQDVVGGAAKAVFNVGEVFGLDLDPSAGRIFVTGGTGVIGQRVATRLLRAGYPNIRVGVLNPDKVEGLSKAGAEVASFSWDREDTFEAALKGVKSVFCSAPYHEGWVDKFPRFLQACQNAGVKHVVKMSFYHARVPGDYFRDVPLVRAHGFCDRLLVNSGMAYTILSASHLMSNPLVYQGTTLRHEQKPGTFFGASADKGVNYVSPNDVAEVAVRSLLAPREHHNKEYTLTGPEPIKDQAVAELLSTHLKKSIMYVDQPLHTFEESEKMGGDPAWMVRDMVALEKIKADGREEDVAFVSKDIENVCGHPAQTYGEYLDFKQYMTPVEMGPEEEAALQQ